jgi:hypothetical protein
VSDGDAQLDREALLCIGGLRRSGPSFVVVLADWCHYCTELKDKLRKAFGVRDVHDWPSARNAGVHFINEKQVAQGTVRGFPTIWAFSRGERDPAKDSQTELFKHLKRAL